MSSGGDQSEAFAEAGESQAATAPSSSYSTTSFVSSFPKVFGIESGTVVPRSGAQLLSQE